MQFTFFKKMCLAILIPVIIAFNVMCIASYVKARDTLRTTLREQLTVLSNTEATGLQSVIRAFANTVEETANDNLTIKTTKAFTDGDFATAMQSKMDIDEKLARIVASSPAVFGVGIVDFDGIIRMHSNQRREGENFSSELFVKNALAGQVIPNVVKIADKQYGLALAQPVYSENAIVGAVFLVLNLEQITKNNIDPISFAKSGAVAVLDNNGTVVMHKNREHVGSSLGDSSSFRDMLGNEFGNTTFVNDEGMEFAWYYTYLPEIQWYVVMTVERADLYSGVTELFYIMTVLVGFFIALLFAIILLFAKKTSSALSGIEHISRGVSQGNLELTAKEHNTLDTLALRSDEIGGLSVSFKAMIVSLIETIKEAKSAHRNGMIEAANKLEGIVATTTQATQSLTLQVQESSNGAQVQAERIASTVTAVEEMNATILEVTQNTVQTAKIANETRNKAEDSEIIVREFMGSMNKVEQSTTSLKEDMTTLSSHIQNINQVMGVISDLADQTNLLALNAAIEAARAGEFGRGFAVVADEVRKLAEKTMASTVHVSSAVQAIQSSSESSMKQVDDTVELVFSAIELAKKCHDALEEISQMASESAERIGSIAVASEEQSATSDEITKTIGEINQIVLQTSSTMREANLAIVELSNQAKNLSAMIENMKG